MVSQPHSSVRPKRGSTSTRPRFFAETIVIIPALNEVDSVATTVRRWLALGVGRVRVVDNGSTDQTTAAAVEAGAEVMIETTRGYGAAAWRGLQDWPADYRWALFSSADGSDRLDADESFRWQVAVESGAEMIVGDRTASVASRRRLKGIQRWGNRAVCQVLEWGWARKLRDLGSLRLVRRDALERMRLQDRGFGWNVEMQVRAWELGISVVEIPVLYYPRIAGESKISGNLWGTLRAGRGILSVLFQVILWRLRSSRRRHMDRRLAERKLLSASPK